MPTQPDGTAAGDLQITGRTGHRRLKERGTHDRDIVNAILDEGLMCHVGVVDGGTPVVTPMAYARVDDHLYLHGAPANRTLRLVADGGAACVTVSLVDALVLARSAFHHSMNYRCVMLFGTGQAVTDPKEKLAASAALVEHMAPGRSGHVRLPNESELRSTLIARFAIEEGSAKIRTGGVKEDDEDLGLPIWAGIIPFAIVPGSGEPDEGLPDGTPVPPYATSYPDRRREVAPGP